LSIFIDYSIYHIFPNPVNDERHSQSNYSVTSIYPFMLLFNYFSYCYSKSSYNDPDWAIAKDGNAINTIFADYKM